MENINEELKARKSKLTEILKGGLIKIYFDEKDDVQKGNIATEINKRAEFDLTNHADFEELYEIYKSVIGRRNDVEVGNRNFNRLKGNGDLETNWYPALAQSEERLRQREKDLNEILDKVASSISKSV